MSAKPPSFPFYGQDFQTGTMAFTPAERGVYVDCLWYQWATGGVPGDDLARLARVMRCALTEARRLWPTIATKFEKGDDGLYRNARLEQVRVEKEAFAKHAADRGAKGARARWLKHASSNAQALLDDGSSLSLSSVPTGQRDARATATPPRLGPRRSHSVAIPPRDLSAFWEGPIFNIPAKWAARALKASNGTATDADVSAFGKFLTAKLERDGDAAPAEGFLGWLDHEWTEWRGNRADDAKAAKAIADTKARMDKLYAEMHAAVADVPRG